MLNVRWCVSLLDRLRVKSSGTVTLAKYTIVSQDSPAIGNIVGGSLTIPKLIICEEAAVELLYPSRDDRRAPILHA